jgi:hypothetical protein
MSKYKKPKEIENCLASELSNLVSEFETGQLTKEGIYNYFRLFMCDAEVDSRITVNVLEQFGDLGKEEARNIKIYEGW